MNKPPVTNVRAKSPGISFNVAMGVFAAGSVAFAAYAMPADLFSDIIDATGISSVVAAAQPPLGQTARIAFIMTAALATFAAVWTLLALIDRISARPAAPLRAETAPPPRIRRADAHPDAPSRRPLLAGADLGEPVAKPSANAEAEREAADAAPKVPAAEPEPVVELPAFLETTQPSPELLEQDDLDEEAQDEEALLALRPEDELTGDWRDEPEDELTADWRDEPQAIEEAVEEEIEEPSIGTLAARLSLPQDESGQSLSKLMQRLENGLQRSANSDTAPSADPRDPSQLVAGPTGHRLRNALGDLQKMAGRS